MLSVRCEGPSWTHIIVWLIVRAGQEEHPRKLFFDVNGNLIARRFSPLGVFQMESGAQSLDGGETVLESRNPASASLSAEAQKQFHHDEERKERTEGKKTLSNSTLQGCPHYICLSHKNCNCMREANQKDGSSQMLNKERV